MNLSNTAKEADIRYFPFVPNRIEKNIKDMVIEIQHMFFSREIFEQTLKLSNNTITMYVYKQGVGIYANGEVKNTDKKYIKDAYVKIFYETKADKILDLYHVVTGKSIAVQVEVVKSAVESNSEGLIKPQVYVYDIFNIDTQKYLLPEERKEVLHVLITLGLKVLPIPVITLAPLNTLSIPAIIVQVKDRIASLGTGEGVVFKSTTTETRFNVIPSE